jgi:hypothetical protein
MASVLFQVGATIEGAFSLGLKTEPGLKETSMKKHAIRKMTLTRETLHLLEEASHEKLQEVAGGAWPVTTVKPYPCQATCLCP